MKEATETLLPRQLAKTRWQRYGAEWLTQQYGGKAAGLAELPTAWVPDFVAIPTGLSSVWQSGGSDAVLAWLAKLDVENARSLSALCEQSSRLIARSSASTELLSQRGRYESIEFDGNIALFEAIFSICSVIALAHEVDPGRQFGVVLQAFMSPDLHGHLSNELRVSPAKEKWLYEVQLQSEIVRRMMKTRGQTPPEERKPIEVRDPWNVAAPLAQIASWLGQQIVPRCHVEWCISGHVCWLLQLDKEHDIDDGIDPRKRVRPRSTSVLEPRNLAAFREYTPGSPTRWSKLRNISDFHSSSSPARHNLFFIEGSSIDVYAGDEASLEHTLCDDMSIFSEGKLVVRTDTVPEAENLPRTDTETSARAASWILECYRKFVADGLKPSQLCFIAHAFIPAKAAAWSFYDKLSSVVYVDSLWGLPDGLQFLPHDSFQVDVKKRKIIKQIRFKGFFLGEQEDGTWQYEKIKPRLGRHATLSSADVFEIADRTVGIAERVQEPAQVMWFCGIPAELGLGMHLPWYRARQFSRGTGQRARFERIVDVRTHDDLRQLAEGVTGKVALRLQPHAPLIRDNSLLAAVADLARSLELPVYLEGSSLGHAFYVLENQGVPVISSGNVRTRRTVGRRLFRKLVRDKIPDRIAAGGESVHAAVIARYDFRFALVAKLLEETMELLNVDEEDAAEEIADLLEVLREIAEEAGLDWRQISTVAEVKRNERGGFSSRRVLLETSIREQQTAALPSLLDGISTLPEVTFAQVAEHRRTPEGFLIPWGVISTLSQFRQLSLDGAVVRLRVRADASGLHLGVEPLRQEQLELPLDLT